MAICQTNKNPPVDKLTEATTDSVKAEAYRSVMAYYRFTKPDSAIWYGNEGLQYFTKNNYKLGQAKLLAALGQIDIINGRTTLAKKRYTDALEIYMQLGNKKSIALCQNTIGTIEGRTGNYNEATSKFFTALKIFEQLKDSNNIRDTYLKLGAVNEITDNLDRALVYYNNAKKINSQDSLSLQALTLYNNIGIIYCKKGEYEKGITSFKEGLNKCNNPEFVSLKCNLLMDYGEALHKLNENAKALMYQNEALALAKKNNLVEDQTRSITNIASILLHTDIEKAIGYLNDALAITQIAGFSALETDIYNNLIDAHKMKGDYKKALEYTQKKQIIVDSITKKERESEISNLQAIYELEKSNAKVKQLNFLITRNTLKRDIIIVIAFVNLVILIILAFSYRKSIRLNRQLVKRSVELTEANEIKDKLFSIIGHDLRGPIGNIPVLLELYEDEETPPEDKQYFFDSIKELAISCKETLDNMLYWGKSNIKGNKINQQVIDTKEYINNCLKLLRSAATQKNIKLIDNTPDDIKITSDAEHFEFVIRNLLSNAIKFTFREGKIEINVKKDQIPGFTVFSVADTGKGIEPSKIPYIFDAIDKGTIGTAHEKGTNIGLKLCKDFITENGGKIWVESEVGKGTTFYFSLKNG